MLSSIHNTHQLFAVAHRDDVAPLFGEFGQGRLQVETITFAAKQRVHERDRDFDPNLLVARVSLIPAGLVHMNPNTVTLAGDPNFLVLFLQGQKLGVAGRFEFLPQQAQVLNGYVVLLELDLTFADGLVGNDAECHLGQSERQVDADVLAVLARFGDLHVDPGTRLLRLQPAGSQGGYHSQCNYSQYSSTHKNFPSVFGTPASVPLVEQCHSSNALGCFVCNYEGCRREVQRILRAAQIRCAMGRPVRRGRNPENRCFRHREWRTERSSMTFVRLQSSHGCR